MSEGGRVLCSHLVRLRVEGADRAPEWANLEEIDAFGAVVAAQQAWPLDFEVSIEADGFRASGYVQSCRSRKQDFALTIEFVEGFRWSEELWRPDHATCAPAKANGAGAGD